MPDVTTQRSSSFWANLGQQYLQIAENTLPQLGAGLSSAIAARTGTSAPNVQVTPTAEPANVDTTGVGVSGKTLLYGGLILLGFVLVFAASGFRHGR